MLGEVALVDRESRVGQLGLVFGDTLLDENAACHIALGAAYPHPIPGASELDEAGPTRARRQRLERSTST